MGFHFIEGLMGGGKSYHGAELCYEALKEGAVVHTNIPLNWDVIDRNEWASRVVVLSGHPGDWVRRVEKDGRKTWASDILVMGKEGGENVVVVDEAAIEISSEDQGKDAAKNSPLFGLVALSRHAGLEIYFLAQRKHHVAKRVRDLAETVTLCENCANIPVLGWFIKRVAGDLRRTVYKDGEKFGSCYLRLKPEICDFYFTHGMRDNLEMKSGGERIKKASAWTQRSVLMIVGGLGLGLAMCSWGLWGTWGILHKSTDEPKKEAKASAAPAKKVERFNPDGTSKEIVIAERPPAPKGGIWFEWDLYDEHVFAGLRIKDGKPIVITRGGLRLYNGGSYEGQTIELQFQVAGWHYFQCTNKRLVVVRPLRPEERGALPPVTVPGRSMIDMEKNNPADGILAGMNPL